MARKVPDSGPRTRVFDNSLAQQYFSCRRKRVLIFLTLGSLTIRRVDVMVRCTALEFFRSSHWGMSHAAIRRTNVDAPDRRRAGYQTHVIPAARILTINGGSSSIKFALFETRDSLRRILEGRIERIGLPEAALTVKGSEPADNFSRPVAAPDHAAAVRIAARLAGGAHRSATASPRWGIASSMAGRPTANRSA